MALGTCSLSGIGHHRGRGGVLHLGVALEDLLGGGGIIDALAGDLQHIASLHKVDDQGDYPAQEDREQTADHAVPHITQSENGPRPIIKFIFLIYLFFVEYF